MNHIAAASLFLKLSCYISCFKEMPIFTFFSTIANCSFCSSLHPNIFYIIKLFLLGLPVNITTCNMFTDYCREYVGFGPYFPREVNSLSKYKKLLLLLF